MNALVEDSSYTSQTAMAYDLSWQAVQKGYIGTAQTYTSFEDLPLSDNYHFIRKYFHVAWVHYVLLLRLCSFKNPFKELTAWYKTRHVRRSAYFKSPIQHSEWMTLESTLMQKLPLVSVIIPTLNRYTYLNDVLKDFESQDYSNFEVIVVDQSDDFDHGFYQQFDLNLHVIQQKEKALWLARNTAITNAKGTFIALSEDDVRIQPDWVSNHLKCIDYFKADISAGVFYPEGKTIPMERSYFSIASQFATGNTMLHKDVFKTVGLFDRQFEKQRMGDGEFGMRAYLSGFKSISNPYASCIDVKASVGGLREMGSWDAFRPSKFFAPRPIPSVLYYYRRYFGDRAARLALLRTVPISILPYQFKKNKPMLFIGALLSVIISPIIFLQVIASWRLASQKIAQGPLIEHLE